MLAEISQQNVNVLIAFGGGIVSFLSPCVLPIVPAYLSLITGLSVGELRESDRTGDQLRRIAIETGLFVAGFTVVFVVLGLISTAIGQTVLRNQATLTRISGVLVILMAIYLAGSQLLRAPGLYGEARFHPHLQRFGPFAAPIAGAAFGLGWTPCIGPVLAAVLGVAAQSGDEARSVVLLIAYSLGLGLPFLLVGLGLGRLAAPLDWVKRNSRAITLVSAAFLFGFGLLLVFNRFELLTARLTDGLEALGLRRLVTLG
jgi:cytochrome c-type biogenesis protein